MGLIFKARGNSSLGPFLIRITIGLLFLIAGAQKIVDIEGFILSLQSMGIMSDNLAFIVGFILPFAQIILGGLYMIGLFTPVVSLLLSFMIFGILISTGNTDSVLPFSYNIVFLACTISTIFSGAGVISFDALLDRKKKRIVSAEEPKQFTPAVNIAEKEIESAEIIIEPEVTNDKQIENRNPG